MIQDNGAPKADRGKARKLIRKKVVEILKGNTAVGDAVFPNASIPPWYEELPVILVYSQSEPAALYGTAPRELERTLEIQVEIIATGPEENKELNTPGTNKSLEDTLDDIAEQVENLLDVDDSLGGEASESILRNTEMEYDSAGAQSVGSCRLTYAVTYYTMSPRENLELENFDSNKIEYNISEDENTREAEDTVNLPT